MSHFLSVSKALWRLLLEVSGRRFVAFIYVRGLRIKSWQLFFLARLINHEETWKYTNESGKCYVLFDA